MQLDFCDFDGLTIGELVRLLEDSYSDSAVVRTREQSKPTYGSFGGYALKYLEIVEDDLEILEDE